MMAKPWNEHRQTITKLYIQEGRTLEDVRGIMKTEYNFEASIRSYRQHFDIWEIGKYNCKKRQQRRRRQSLKRPILPSPLRSPPALSSSSETSDPGSSPASSCASQRSPEQLPLPALQQTPRYAGPPFFELPSLQSSTLPEPRIKVESGGGGGGGTGWRDMPMYPSAHPPQSVLQSNVHYTYADSAHWHVPRPSLQLPPPPSTFLSSNHSSNEYCGSSYRCVPEFPRHEMTSGLRAPNLSMVRGHGRHGALHPPSVNLPVSFQGVASG